MTPHRTPRRAAVLLSLLTALALMAGTAQAATPTSRFAFGKAIEGLSSYQKQTTCSPTAKAGTTKLKDLLLKTYPGSRNLGIVRACSVGGTSEHKEGRAFDWGVRVDRAAEKAQAQALITWLLATDKHGNRAANARRLGVMYVIWNKRIWGAYAAGSGWRAYTGSNPHTDHVHISLSRTGAAGLTSFWTGKVNGGSAPTPAPVPTPTPAPTHPVTPTPAPLPGAVTPPVPAATLPAGPALQDETVVVPASTAGVRTAAALVRGQRYRVEVRGTWAYDSRPGSVADGECSRSATDGVWRKTRALNRSRGDQLGVYLDGRDLSFGSYDRGSCATSTHTYETSFTATRTGRVPVRVFEPTSSAGWRNNKGSLRVRIIRDVVRDSMTTVVSARDAAGTTTPGSVVGGALYSVTVTGTFTAGKGITADATCASRGSDWFRRLEGLSRGQLDLRLAGARVNTDCRRDHSYSVVWRAPSSGPQVLDVRDEVHSDNAGGLRVNLVRLPDEDANEGWGWGDNGGSSDGDGRGSGGGHRR